METEQLLALVSVAACAVSIIVMALALTSSRYHRQAAEHSLSAANSSSEAAQASSNVAEHAGYAARQALAVAQYLAPAPAPSVLDPDTYEIIGVRTIDQPRIPGTTVTVTAYVDPDAPEDPAIVDSEYATQVARKLYGDQWFFAVVRATVTVNGYDIGRASLGMRPHGITGPGPVIDSLSGPAVDTLISEATDDAVATLATIERAR